MNYLVDTDIASAYLRGDGRVFNRFVQHGGGLALSILSLAELYCWVYLADRPETRERGLWEMISDVPVLSLDDEIARKAGQIRAELQRKGVNVPSVDLMIGCTALQNDLTVVTHNQRHFALIPGLRIEDWLAG